MKHRWSACLDVPLVTAFDAQTRSGGQLLFHLCQLLLFSRSFGTPWTVARQAPLSVGFPRREYWSGLPFPPLGDLSEPGMEPLSLVLPALGGGSFTTVQPMKLPCLSHSFPTALRTFPHMYILHFLLHLKFVKRVDLTCSYHNLKKNKKQRTLLSFSLACC